LRFADRIVVLTGAGRGIGAATARRLVTEGAKVVVSDLDEAVARETADAIGDAATAVACDVTDRASVEALVATTVELHGRVDGLVACAGVTRDNLVFRMTDDDWDTVIDTHLKGSFYAARAVQVHMVNQRYGKICLLSSASARGNRGQVNYSAAKAGLQGMARSLAIELGRYGINVNAVAPGFVDTRMTRQTAERIGMDYEQLRSEAAARLPLGRVGTPEDIAGVIAFVCSDDASFMTGQTLYARGGP
jgi:3-oxoacyl-[acyl-carrier protein] reductase